MKKYEINIESMLRIGGYDTLKKLGKAIGVSPQTINSHKKAGKIPDKLAIRFSRIHNCFIDSEGYFVLTKEQNKSENTGNSTLLYVQEDLEMNELINMLVHIRNNNEEAFDSLYGKITRKFHEMKTDEGKQKAE